MKTERAIELLNRISDSQFDGQHGDERREALDMAIRALEQNLVQESGDLVQDLVKDCISRQQAIDALDKHIDTFDAIDTNYLCGLRTAMSILKEMPSAQPVNYGSTKSDSSSQLKLNNDLISRQAVIDTVSKWFYDVFGITESDGTATIFKRLRDLPSARTERKKGKWILSDDREWKTCSECGAEVDVSMGTGVYVGVDAVDELCFCPNCGADMRGESDV